MDGPIACTQIIATKNLQQSHNTQTTPSKIRYNAKKASITVKWSNSNNCSTSLSNFVEPSNQ